MFRFHARIKPTATARRGIIFICVGRNEGDEMSGRIHRTAAPPHTDVKDIRIIGRTT